MSFTGDIEAWVAKTQRRMIAVFQTSASFLAEEIIERTPVDTGFLRASFSTQLNRPVQIGDSGQDMSAISQAGVGDTIYMGFGAVYAMRIEYGFDGPDSLGRVYHQAGAAMVRLSVQNWPLHVKKAIASVRSSGGTKAA